MRVRLRLRGRKGSIVSSALVNSGFETEEPEILLPRRLAESLEITPMDLVRFRAAGGVELGGGRVRNPIKLELILEDREPIEAEAIATILPGEDEVIISDRLAADLGIVILNPYLGEWCLIDELGGRRRKSVEKEIWR